MLRKFKFAIVLATLVMVSDATAQTKCRGYKSQASFGQICAWGCGDLIECNCTVGACADGTVVVL